MPSKPRASHKLSSVGILQTIKKQFDEFPDMDLAAGGMHKPQMHTVNFILRKYLSDKDEKLGWSYDARAPYMTKKNLKMVYGALVKFYRSKGLLAPKFKKMKFSRTPESVRIETGKSKSTGKKSRRTRGTKGSRKVKSGKRSKSVKKSRRSKSGRRKTTSKSRSKSRKSKRSKSTRRRIKDILFGKLVAT